MDTIMRGLALTFIIAIGVIIGNISSYAITTYIAAKAMEEGAARMKAEANARSKKIAQEAAARKKELARQAAAQKKRNEELQKRREEEARTQAKLNSTCTFWISEYTKNRTDYDKAQRDVACRTAGRPFN